MERKEMEKIIKSFVDSYIRERLPEKYSKTCPSQKQPKVRKLINCDEFDKSTDKQKIEILQSIALDCAEIVGK
jgi:hypothetical protein